MGLFSLVEIDLKVVPLFIFFDEPLTAELTCSKKRWLVICVAEYNGLIVEVG